eukprot:1214865-Prymnesium_polylepis.1
MPAQARSRVRGGGVGRAETRSPPAHHPKPPRRAAPATLTGAPTRRAPEAERVRRRWHRVAVHCSLFTLHSSLLSFEERGTLSPKAKAFCLGGAQSMAGRPDPARYPI